MEQFVDISHLVEQYKKVLQGQNNQQMKEINEYLKQCEKNPQFYQYLVKIFNECNEQNLRLQALLHLKAIITRNWVSERHQMRKSNKNAYFPSDSKEQIKQFIFNQIVNENNQQVRKIIDSMLGPIIKSEFPQNYTNLHQFMFQFIKSLKDSLNTQYEIIFDEQIKQKLKTIKTVLKEQSKKRLQNSKSVFYEMIYPIFEEVRQIQIFTKTKLNQLQEMTIQQNMLDSINQFTYFSYQIDSLMMLMILSSHNEAHNDENIINIILEILHKIRLLIQLLEYFKDYSSVIQIL